MTEFALAYLLFIGTHVVPAVRGVRGAAVARLGRRGYLAAYSLLSTLLLVWLVVATRSAPTLPLWPTTPALARVPVVVMPFAFILIACGLSAPNTLSISWRNHGFDPARPGIVAVTRHPVLWGLLLWAVAHVPPNGDVVSVALFGGLSIYAAMGFYLADARARQRLGPARWAALSAGTSVMPFAAMLAGRARLAGDAPLLAAALAGLALYALFLAGGHAWLIGVDSLAVADLR